MLIPEGVSVQVSRTLPSGRLHTDDVPAKDLGEYLARRPDGRGWGFHVVGGKIRMRGGKGA